MFGDVSVRSAVRGAWGAACVAPLPIVGEIGSLQVVSLAEGAVDKATDTAMTPWPASISGACSVESSADLVFTTTALFHVKQSSD